MSDLVAIAYDDPETAKQVRKELIKLTKERATVQTPGERIPQERAALELDDAVVVTRAADGKIVLDQSGTPVASGAARGALWGGLIGILFLAPMLGAAMGAAAGGLGGKMADTGIDDSFMEELGESLTPGSAALILLVGGRDPNLVVSRVARYGGRVIQTSLEGDAESRLQAALAQFNVPA